MSWIWAAVLHLRAGVRVRPSRTCLLHMTSGVTVVSLVGWGSSDLPDTGVRKALDVLLEM